MAQAAIFIRRCPLNFSLCVFGFAPGQLRRLMSTLKSGTRLICFPAKLAFRCLVNLWRADVVRINNRKDFDEERFVSGGFSEALRHELENTNITVSIVYPGGIKTNIANNARIGAGIEHTEAERLEKVEKFNQRLAATCPEQAAEIIVKGIKCRETRILIGSDAKSPSLFARFFPRRYYSIVNFVSGGKLKNV